MRAMLLMGLAGVLLAQPAMAQDKAESPPQTIRSVLLYGNDDNCPKSTSKDEIVVCTNAGDSPYRIPKDLRRGPPDVPHQSWVNRAKFADEAAQQNRPDSCSPIGTFGQTGCAMQMGQEWRAARKAIAEEENAGK